MGLQGRFKQKLTFGAGCGATRGRWESYTAKGGAAIAEASKAVRVSEEASAEGYRCTQGWWFNIPTTGNGPHSICPHKASLALRQGLCLEGPTPVTEMVHLPGVCSCLCTLKLGSQVFFRAPASPPE